MNWRWSSAISFWQESHGAREISRRAFLAVYILTVMLIGLGMNFAPAAGTDYRVILVLCGGLMFMLSMVWWRVPRLFTLLLYAVTAQAVLMVLYSAAYSGGIHSPAMVWLSIFPVPVLMLRGPTAALAWVGLIELLTFGMMQASERGWISAHVNASNAGLAWALFNAVMALLGLLLSVTIYQRMHAAQLKELRMHNRELQAMHRALIQAQAHKDEFVAAVSHELRTPMNAILGFNSVLRAELAGQPDQLEWVDHIRHSTGHLLQVVDEILVFSQLQAGKVQLLAHDFDLPVTLHELMAVYQERASAKALDCELLLAPDLPQHVHMDRLRLHQMLGLLLDNAIKFTTRGHVHLAVSLAGHRLRFEVRDTGCGIAADRQSHIFKRFEHADVQTNRIHGGTGLGLTICHHMVDLHGGRIGLASLPDQGTTFWLELPWQPACEGDGEHLPQSMVSDQHRLDVLVVDDNLLNLKVAQLQIQKIWPQAQITAVTSAAEALLWLDKQAFDVALVDMVMPEMDGLALTRQIRQRFPTITARMPIIALTANTLPQERQRCLQAGMDEVLYKPIQPEQLAQAVSRHFYRRQAEVA